MRKYVLDIYFSEKILGENLQIWRGTIDYLSLKPPKITLLYQLTTFKVNKNDLYYCELTTLHRNTSFISYYIVKTIVTHLSHFDRMEKSFIGTL